MELYEFPENGLTMDGDEALFQDDPAVAPVWKRIPAGTELTPQFVGMVRRPKMEAAVKPAVLALGEVIKIMTAGGNPAQDKTALREWAPRAMSALKAAAPLITDPPPRVSLQ